MSAIHEPLTQRQFSRSSRRSRRRLGYTSGALVSLVVLWLVNVWPGWEVVPFLTEPTTEVIGLVNASLVASLAIDLLLLADDRPRLRAATDLVTGGFAVAVLVRLLVVFPFDFAGSSLPWAGGLRGLLILATVGGSIGLLTTLPRLLPDRPDAVDG